MRKGGRDKVREGREVKEEGEKEGEGGREDLRSMPCIQASTTLKYEYSTS